MTMRHATFTLTTAASGFAEADASLSGYVSTRHAWLDSVGFDDSAATSQAVSLSIFQIDLDDDGTTQVERNQLFYAESDVLPSDGQTLLYPRPTGTGVDNTGQSTSVGGETGRIPIRSRTMRCRVLGGALGDVYTVNVYYETSGDYRF